MATIDAQTTPTATPAAAHGPQPVAATASGNGVWKGGLADTIRGAAKSSGDDMLDPLEKKRLQAQLGAGKAKDTKYFLRKSGVTETLEATEGATVDDGVCTLYFRECENSRFEIQSMSAKIMIDLCTNCTFVVSGKVVTATIEMYKCAANTMVLSVPIRTIQADLCDGAAFQFARAEDFDRIVWAGTEGLRVTFDDTPAAVIETGYTPMTIEHGPSLRKDIDQFICRNIEGSGLTCERITRLDNGFPTTARERAAFEDRQERNLRELAKRVYGEDIQIPKKKRTTTKILPNQPCPCGRGKKYKKCCANKAGVEFTQDQIDRAIEAAAC
eukprot:c19826_g1_i2.p2 GENE.c19826_g1_i2~~c19826_g1_i2.p2  ORF type:complete len:328 (+),score=72.34 c19826_g1_i2:62-1045(+)